MIKALKLYCLICLVALASGVQAQTVTDPVKVATDEAIHRQADTILLRRTLVDAQAARARGDLLGAHKLYERCYNLMQRIGPGGIEPEAQQTIAGLSEVLMALAREDQKHQDYKAAAVKYDRLLVVDPTNQVVIDARRDNQRRLEAQAGTIPSQDTIERVPSFRAEEVSVGTLVQDGKLLYEAGHLDEAEVKLKEAYERDPSNVAATQYLSAIQQKRMADANRRTELNSNKGLLQVEKEWNRDRSNGELIAKPNAFARSEKVYTGKGRQAILSKLDRIRIDTVKYDDLPLTEVINNLSEIARQRDPDKVGINFYIDRDTPVAAPAAAAGAIDPATGLPVAAPLPTEAADFSAITVKITPALTDVRLADVLDAITKTASKPIRYSILDYAIVFNLRGQESAQLEIRTFHVDPNTFRMGLESVSGIEFGNVSTGSGGGGGSTGGGGGGGGNSGGAGNTGTTAILPQVNVTGGSVSGGGGVGGGSTGGSTGGGLRYVTSRTNDMAQVQVLVRTFLATIGLDFNTNNPANVGKSVVWNDRKGILLVRSTPQDLDIIDAAIQALNQAPPEVNIKAKFIEITQNDNRGLGFQWTLGNTQIGSAALASGGTQPSFNGAPSSGNPEGTFPGSFLYGTTTPPSQSDGVLSQGLRSTFGGGNTESGSLPTVGTLTGILTNPQFRVAIQALEQRDGVDELNAPEVTTESGRQAQIQAVDIQTIVTGNQVQANSGSSVSGVANGVNSPIVQAIPTVNYSTSPLPFGPVLDVIPYVSADEYSVQMTLIPTITEFLRYDDPGLFVPAALVSSVGGGGNPSLQAVLPLPHFRMRQVTTSVTVWDAQTVVLGGLLTDSVTKIKDKIPMLGDLPLVGRLFQSQSSAKTKKNLMIFVTPTIINPDGTRYHSDDEMPYAQNAVPVQPAVVR